MSVFSLEALTVKKLLQVNTTGSDDTEVQTRSTNLGELKNKQRGKQTNKQTVHAHKQTITSLCEFLSFLLFISPF